MIEPKIDFLGDLRVQKISAQAEAFLGRLLALLEHPPSKTFLNKHGHVPAEPALLRHYAYPRKPEVRRTHIEHVLKELESASIVTAYEDGFGRWLILEQGKAVRTKSLRSPGPERELALPKGDERRVVQIYSQEHGPPSANQEEITAVAAAASGSLDLIARLRELFPRHDVSKELERYIEHRKKIGKPAIPTGFAKWMIRAEVPLDKPKEKKRPQLTPAPERESSADDAQMDLFDEARRIQFEKDRARYKERKRA